MINKRYFDFKENLNENVQQAKVYLKNLALKKKKEAAGETEGPVGLSADEVRAAETNPNFIKIKDICRENPGYTYLFTKIFFDEYKEDTEKFIDLQNLYNEIKGLGNLVKELPMPLDRYAAIKPTDDDQRPISERIQDDIEKVKLNKTFKKFYDQLYSSQKEWVDKASLQQKEKLRGIGVAFSEMGKDDDDRVDEKYQKSLHRVFFSKIKDYKNLDQIIDAAVNYIKSVNNNQFSKFIKKIDDVNARFGLQNGARIVYDEDGYLVIEVNSFIANRELNGHTSHCIARSGGYWDNYLKDFNKQYYVYNFNLDPSDNKSVIGMTIQPDGKMSAAHLKNDNNCLSDFKSIVAEWKLPFTLFAPMTPQEVETKRKRIEANKLIMKDSLTVEEAEKALANGADPNARGGAPLLNAVKADNIELAQLLLNKGAMPNLGDDESTRAISQSKSFEMLKLLVSKGASVTQLVFRNMKDDLEAVRYLLEAGMDPSFEQSYPFRMAAKSGNIEMMKLILEFADNVQGKETMSVSEKKDFLIIARRYMALKMAAENGQLEAIKFMLDELREINNEVFQTEEKLDSFFKSLMSWITTSHKIEKNSLDQFSTLLNQYQAKKESFRFKSFKVFKY